jgi:hypothetical protein
MDRRNGLPRRKLKIRNGGEPPYSRFSFLSPLAHIVIIIVVESTTLPLDF